MIFRKGRPQPYFATVIFGYEASTRLDAKDFLNTASGNIRALGSHRLPDRHDFDRRITEIATEMGVDPHRLAEMVERFDHPPTLSEVGGTLVVLALGMLLVAGFVVGAIVQPISYPLLATVLAGVLVGTIVILMAMTVFVPTAQVEVITDALTIRWWTSSIPARVRTLLLFDLTLGPGLFLAWHTYNQVFPISHGQFVPGLLSMIPLTSLVVLPAAVAVVSVGLILHGRNRQSAHDAG